GAGLAVGEAGQGGARGGGAVVVEGGQVVERRRVGDVLDRGGGRVGGVEGGVAQRLAALEAAGLLVGHRHVRKVDAGDLVGLAGGVGDLRGVLHHAAGQLDQRAV